MSLLDDFDVIEASVSKETNNTIFTKFIDDFIVRYSGEVMFSRHQRSSEDFGVSVIAMKNKIHKYVHFIEDCNYKIEVSWDLSEWLEKSVRYCYIGFDYLCVNNKCTIKFKLFDATKHIPKDGIKITEYNYNGLYSWNCPQYKNTAHANELNGYKILSVGNMYSDKYEGWMVFDIDNVISWITNKPSVDDEYSIFSYPNIYKVIPYNIAEHDYKKYDFDEIFKAFY